MSEERSNTKPAKRRRGDRRDGRWIKAPGLQTVMMYILPKRTECEVYMKDTFDCTNLLAFIEEENRIHPEYRTTLFHGIIAILARMLRERPKMNCFIQGFRMYERNEISLSFVVKRRFSDNGEESLMYLVPKDTDTIREISSHICGNVAETRKSEHSTGGIDEVIDKFASLPRFILIPVMRIIRYLDFWGLNPRVLTDGDPNYSSILLSNLGSIKCPAVYHHLNNYGTNSIMVTVGTMRNELVKMPDGTMSERTLVDISATLDERIADGFYFARSLKLIHHVLEHPELLLKPFCEPSGFDYK